MTSRSPAPSSAASSSRQSTRSGGNTADSPASSSWARVMFVEQDAVAAGEAELAPMLALGLAEDRELGAAQLVHQAEEVLADLADRVLVHLDVVLAALGPVQLDLLVGAAGDLPGDTSP